MTSLAIEDILYTLNEKVTAYTSSVLDSVERNEKALDQLANRRKEIIIEKSKDVLRKMKSTDMTVTSNLVEDSLACLSKLTHLGDRVKSKLKEIR